MNGLVARLVDAQTVGEESYAEKDEDHPKNDQAFHPTVTRLFGNCCKPA
jgi:hypothetical protein